MAKDNARTLRVYAALAPDISNGHVWLKDDSLKSRSIVRIKDMETGKVAYCEALQFEGNFVKAYQAARTHEFSSLDSSIVMG